MPPITPSPDMPPPFSLDFRRLKLRVSISPLRLAAISLFADIALMLIFRHG